MTWHNRVLRVDLTHHTTHIEPLNEQWRDQYLGSRGLGTKYHQRPLNQRDSLLEFRWQVWC